jgi:trk system potassium uptake protein TrkA
MHQYAVIGVGNFGYYLAVQLYKKGHEVLAVDVDENRVQRIKDKVSRAVIADATDPEALEPLGLAEMDAVCVSLGDNLSDSILVTLHLKDLGVQRLLVKCFSETHGRVLRKVGASDVLHPEKDMAGSLAERLHSPNVIEYLPFLEGYSIVEITPPEGFFGKPLKELDLINRYGVQVIAVKETQPEGFNMVPTGNCKLKESDILIVLGSDEGIQKLKDEASG